MITRNRQKKMNNTEKSTENNTNNMDTRMKIPNYTGEGTLTIQNWIILFERKTESQAEERNNLIVEYLSDHALNYYIEQNLFDEEWINIKEKLTTYFSKEKVISSQQFLNLNLEDCSCFEEYYRQKTDAARKMKIEEKLLTELLTNGLPQQQKILNFTQNFGNVSEWYHFNQSLYYQLKEETDKKPTPKVGYQQNNYQEQMKPKQNKPAWYPPPNYYRPPTRPYGNYGTIPPPRHSYPRNSSYDRLENPRYPNPYRVNTFKTANERTTQM